MLPREVLTSAIFLATCLATGKALLFPLLFPVSIKISINSHRKHAPPPSPKPDYHFQKVPVYKEVVVKDGGHSYKHSYGDGHKYGSSYGDGHVKVYTNEPHIKGHRFSKGYGSGSSIHFPGPSSTHFQASAYAHPPKKGGTFLSFEASINSKPHLPHIEYAHPIPEGHYKGTEYEQPVGHHKGTEYVQPIGHHKGTEYVQPIGHHKGTEYVQPIGHHKGTEYVQPVEHHKGTDYIEPVGHHKGTEYVQPGGHYDAEYVLQDGHHKGTQYIQPGEHHKGTDYVVQDGHDKGTEYVLQNGHHKGTDYIVQEGHHKGTEYVQPGGHHKGTDYAIQEGHQKGTEYIQPGEYHKGTQEGHHKGTEYIQPSKGGLKPYVPQQYNFIKSVGGGYKMSDYLPVKSTGHHGFDEKPNKYITTSHVAIPPGEGQTYASISAAHQASHAPKAYDGKEYADLGVRQPVQDEYGDESGYLDDSMPAYKYPPTRYYAKRNGVAAPNLSSESALYAGFGTSVYGDSYARVTYRPKNLRISIKAFRH